ncbi:hypothetical protein BDI4_590083 [Burkholderia diffusa]|nr:hypothetical protein BDI4_590083 [Burkholderia diffusa]
MSSFGRRVGHVDVEVSSSDSRSACAGQLACATCNIYAVDAPRASRPGCSVFENGLRHAGEIAGSRLLEIALRVVDHHDRDVDQFVESLQQRFAPFDVFVALGRFVELLDDRVGRLQEGDRLLIVFDRDHRCVARADESFAMLVRQIGHAADARQDIRDALQERRDLFFEHDGALAQRGVFIAEIGVAGLSGAVHRRYECVVRSRHDTRRRALSCLCRGVVSGARQMRSAVEQRAYAISCIG